MSLRKRLFDSAVRQGVTPPDTMADVAQVKTQQSEWFGMDAKGARGKGRGAFVVGIAGKGQRGAWEDVFEYDLGAFAEGGGGRRGGAGLGALLRSRSTGRLRGIRGLADGDADGAASDDAAGGGGSDGEAGAASVHLRGRRLARRRSSGAGRRRSRSRPRRAKSQPAPEAIDRLLALRRAEAPPPLAVPSGRLHGTVFLSRAAGPVLGGETMRLRRAPTAKARSCVLARGAVFPRLQRIPRCTH